jgi:hypothetical protein
MRTLFDSSSGEAANEHATPQAERESHPQRRSRMREREAFIPPSGEAAND